MKKHISVMYLLLLPLVPQLPLLGMEKTSSPIENQTLPTNQITEDPLTAHKLKLTPVLEDLIKKYDHDKKSKEVDLTKSMIVTSTPKNEGLNGWLYTNSFIYQPENLIYHALKNGSFDPNNKTHLKYLEDAFNTQLKNNNTKRILAMIDLCTKYGTQIELNQRITREIHEYLEEQNNKQEENAKNTILNTNINFTCKRDALIIKFQEETIKTIQELHKLLDEYTKNHADSFHQHAELIREYRKGNAGIHLTNPLLILQHTASCSDKHLHQEGFIRPNQVGNTITNKHLLAKTKLDLTHRIITEKTCAYIETLNIINKDIKNIKID